MVDPKKPASSYRSIIDESMLAQIMADDEEARRELSVHELGMLLAMTPKDRLAASERAFQVLTPDDLVTYQRSVLADAAKAANLVVINGWLLRLHAAWTALREGSRRTAAKTDLDDSAWSRWLAGRVEKLLAAVNGPYAWAVAFVGALVAFIMWWEPKGADNGQSGGEKKD